VSVEDNGPAAELLDDEDAADRAWTESLLSRLHRLSPTGFEEFCLYLLRRFGLELTRVGGTGDEGVDGIGTAATTVTPRVDLIDGERLCELVLEQQVGIWLRPIVNETWFDRFDDR
jgi:restriction endonuclease Mrr